VQKRPDTHRERKLEKSEFSVSLLAQKGPKNPRTSRDKFLQTPLQKKYFGHFLATFGLRNRLFRTPMPMRIDFICEQKKVLRFYFPSKVDQIERVFETRKFHLFFCLEKDPKRPRTIRDHFLQNPLQKNHFGHFWAIFGANSECDRE
tara:strand:- start:91 stop:531 length:441 start_codon:yes stop_codon:yes gene_type:complete